MLSAAVLAEKRRKEIIEADDVLMAIEEENVPCNADPQNQTAHSGTADLRCPQCGSKRLYKDDLMFFRKRK